MAKRMARPIPDTQRFDAPRSEGAVGVRLACPPMTPEECAARTTPAVSGIAAQFMLDGKTYEAGAGHGFAGLDFYAAGRAGVLGDLDADVVTDRFGFFEPGAVAGWLSQASAVMAPADTSAAFMACAYDWADDHLGDDVDWERLADLLGTVNAAAPDDDVPLFAAWRSAPEPDPTRGPKALALHRFQVLRELRNEHHVASVRDAGLQPVEALALKTPGMAGLFGWSDLPEVGDDHRAQHEAAEAETNRRVAAAYAALSDAERNELVSLAAAALASVH